MRRRVPHAPHILGTSLLVFTRYQMMKMIERITTIVLLAMVWAAGHDTGHRAAVQAHYNHPACHPPLKP